MKRETVAGELRGVLATLFHSISYTPVSPPGSLRPPSPHLTSPHLTPAILVLLSFLRTAASKNRTVHCRNVLLPNVRAVALKTSLVKCFA